MKSVIFSHVGGGHSVMKFTWEKQEKISLRKEARWMEWSGNCNPLGYLIFMTLLLKWIVAFLLFVTYLWKLFQHDQVEKKTKRARWHEILAEQLKKKANKWTILV